MLGLTFGSHLVEVKGVGKLIVCGIDSGTLNSISYVAWLVDHQFTFDIYVPTVDHPLPSYFGSGPQPVAFALDCPQSLPLKGNPIREADRLAQTPTKRLPENREQLRTWKAYGGLIQCGITVFWAIYQKRLAQIEGLENESISVRAGETYPRYVINRLWPSIKIPSKKKEPLSYIDEIWPRILDLGFTCRSVHRPTVDQLDAAICAVVAYRMVTYSGRLLGTVGTTPLPDEDNNLLREGFIISP